MAGPYNIDDDINAGDPGQLAWAESVAQAINDLDLRVEDSATTTYVDNRFTFAAIQQWQDTAAFDAYDLDSARGAIANGITDMGTYTGLAQFDGLFVGIPLATHYSSSSYPEMSLVQTIAFADEFGAWHEVRRYKTRVAPAAWSAWSAWEVYEPSGGVPVPLAHKPDSTPTWRSPWHQANANSAASTENRVYLWDCPIYWPVSLDGLGTRIQGTAVGGTTRLLLYDDDGAGNPGNLVASTSALDASSVAFIGETFTPVTLEPGMYHIGFIVNDAAVFFHRAQTSFSPFEVQDAGTGAVPSVAVGNDAVGRYWDQGSYSVPSTIGTLGTSAGANGENIRPVIYLRMASI